MRLVVVSNRLPFTATKKDDALVFRTSTGGLSSGLTAYLKAIERTTSQQGHIWVGWPGATVEESDMEKLKSKAASDYHASPVFLDAETMEKFYHGFCNSTIWPLFHYFPSYARFNEEYWAQYVRVNEAFRDAVLEIVQSGDLVWVHDYHLMLLPSLLRREMDDSSIGFFLHTPFPSYDIFRVLPTRWRREMLEGVLGADLVGFHTIDYVQHFLRCVLRILGYDHSFGQILVEGERVVRVDTFPMGIDYQRFHESAKTGDVQRAAEELRQRLGNLKIILSVDRLDYTKGIKNRLEAYATFLERYPHWLRRVVLVLSVVPSRLGAEHYQEMKEEIDRLVGSINGKFGSIGWTPVVYRYSFLPFNQLLSLFEASSVALVTPLRDGMNLIAKEFIASKTDGRGVLVLSEMAGASRELGEALIINPNNTWEIVDALNTALEMPEKEQVLRNGAMQNRLQRYDVTQWGHDFTDKLYAVKEEQKRFNAKLLDTETRKRLVRDFATSKNKILFLDYDGTLSPSKDSPDTPVPSETLLAVLKQLSEDPESMVVIVSRHNKSILQEWFGSLEIGIVAEHGAWIREKGKEWRPAITVETNWKEKILPTIRAYEDRLPRSFVEEKEFSLAWHYRESDPELASIRSRELADELSYFSENTEVQVLQGSKVIEVRNVGINKASAAKLLSEASFDFVLAMGDDWTDEELFRAIPQEGYSIRVGMTKSFAKFNLRNSREAVQLLKELGSSNQQ